MCLKLTITIRSRQLKVDKIDRQQFGLTIVVAAVVRIRTIV